MFTYHLWVEIFGADDQAESNVSRIKDWLQEDRRSGVRALEWSNGVLHLHASHSRNHVASELNDLLRFVRAVGRDFPEAHGLLVASDDENETDPVQVFVLRSGEVRVGPRIPELAAAILD